MTNISLSRYRPLAVQRKRLGPRRDGGYIVPVDGISGSYVLLSLGVDYDVSFDWAFVKANPRVGILAVDGKISVTNFAKRILGSLSAAVRDFVIHRDARRGLKQVRSMLSVLGGGMLILALFGRKEHSLVLANVGRADDVGVLSLQTLLHEHVPPGVASPTPDLFLKMDVEGAEYEVTSEIVRSENRFRGMVIEWHDLHLRWSDFQSCMESLLEYFAVCHVHGNNNRNLIPGTCVPSVLEVSFISRRLVSEDVDYSAESFPVAGLDYPNNPSYPDIPISF